MATLSLCMIVRNEEDVILRCLDSVYGLFDEIIVVDTGSTDNTINLLKQRNVKIFNYKWINDFSAARNFSFSKATCDYIMWLDADDIVEESELKKLIDLKNSLKSEDVIMLKYLVGVNTLNPLTYYRERIVKRSLNLKWVDPIHEVIVPYGNIKYFDIYITHKKEKTSDPKRNLKIYNLLIKNKQTLSPRQMFYYARELYYNKHYKKSIIWFKKFLKTSTGFIENYIEACLNIAFCYENLNDFKSAKQFLFYSFIFDTPRSEILCEIANIYFLENNLNAAIYYYKLALKNIPNINSGGFINESSYNFVPYLQLCVCYYRLNNMEKSKHYFLKAKKINPIAEVIKFNEVFFK